MRLKRAKPAANTLARDALWARVLDMSGFDALAPHQQAENVADFLSLFEIPTETEGYVPMRMEGSHEYQFDNLVMMFEDWKAGTRADFINPKSRRRGVSQGWRAVFFERTVRVAGWRGAIVAQTDPDSMVHLQSLHELAAQIPRSALSAAGIKQVKSGAREIAFRHGSYKTSSVVVKTASSRGLGRGGQLNGVLQTERPHWAPKAKKDRSSFLGSCRMTAGNVVVDESTANQYDEFYADVQATRDGLRKAHLVFLPSHEHAINTLPFRSRVEMDTLIGTLGKVKQFGGANEREAYERRMLYRTQGCGWSEADAQADALLFLNWRRSKIEIDCGNLLVFHREEPTTLEEAFHGSARTVLPLDIMLSWMRAAGRKSREAQRGELVVVRRGGTERVELVAKRDGVLVVYEEPVAGNVYCWGSDVAGGWEVQASSGKTADYSTMTVKEVFSGRTVAEVEVHEFPKEFALRLLTIAAWYNGAKGYLETNLETVASLLIEDADLEVVGYVGQDVMLTSERKMRVVGVGTQVSQVYGFKTSGKSKEYLAARHERFMVEWGAIEEGQEKDSPVGIETLLQMKVIVRKQTAHEKAIGARTQTRIEAETGHDDRWVGEALAVLARDEVLTSGDVPLMSRASAPPLPRDSTSAQWYLDHVREQERDRLDPVLGEAF